MAGQIFHHAGQGDGLRGGALQPSRPSVLFESFGQGTVHLLMVETVFVPRVGTSQGRHFVVVQDVVHHVGGDGGRRLLFDLLNDGGAAAGRADRPHVLLILLKSPCVWMRRFERGLIFIHKNDERGVVFDTLLVGKLSQPTLWPRKGWVVEFKGFVIKMVPQRARGFWKILAQHGAKRGISRTRVSFYAG